MESVAKDNEARLAAAVTELRAAEERLAEYDRKFRAPKGDRACDYSLPENFELDENGHVRDRLTLTHG